MDYSNEENQKKPVTNNHLKQLFGLDDNLQSNYFLEKQKKYWESLKPANDNNSKKSGGENA